MRSLRTLLGVTALCMFTSMPLSADDQDAAVREQVQQERTQALDRLSRLRQRIDQMQIQLEKLDIEKVVKQRLQQGSKPAEQKPSDELSELTASVLHSEWDSSPSSLDSSSIKNRQSEFSGTTAELSNLTSTALDSKRRFFEARGKVKAIEPLFKSKAVTKEEMQRAQDEYKLAAEAIDTFESQIYAARSTRQKLLESLHQERALIEIQIADAQLAYESARATKGPVAAAKRELLLLDRQIANTQDSMDQFFRLTEIIRDREVQDSASALPATSK